MTAQLPSPVRVYLQPVRVRALSKQWRRLGLPGGFQWRGLWCVEWRHIFEPVGGRVSDEGADPVPAHIVLAYAKAAWQAWTQLSEYYSPGRVELQVWKQLGRVVWELQVCATDGKWTASTTTSSPFETDAAIFNLTGSI